MTAKKQHPEMDEAINTADAANAEATEAEAANTDTADDTAPAAEAAPAQAAARTDAASDQPPDDATAATEADTDDPLAQAERRAQEYLESLKRERAAFQNYKKRVERERVEQRQIAVGEVLLKLLPTLDDFHRAMEAIPDTERDDDWFQGVVLIRRKLERFLEEQGVREMDAHGATFDPAYHEAVGVDTESDAESGTITAVLQRGYLHGDRVLRAAMVRVAE